LQIQQKQARAITDKQVDDISLQILAVYEDSLKSVTDELEKLYTKYLSGIDPRDYYNTVIKLERLAKLKAQIVVLYTKAATEAGVLITEASTLSMSNAYYKNQFIADFFVPTIGAQISFTALPPGLVNLAVTGNIEKWLALDADLRKSVGDISDYIAKDGETLSALLLGNRNDEIVKINRAITSGLLQGKGYTDTASDVKKVIGTVKKDLTTGAMAKALRIVRTESNRTYNTGAFANSQALDEQGIEFNRIWVSALDINTRNTHQTLDGQTVGPEEPFSSGGAEAMYPGGFGIASQDVNCRCSTIDAVDGIPPSARIGRNEDGELETFDWTSYPEWAESNGLIQDEFGKWS